MKNKDFVSRIINDINALNKDSHVSRRWILSIGRQKARSYISQRWDEGSIMWDDSLLTHVNCLEMERIRSVDCCFAEFKMCDILMRSKYRLPEIVYGRMGPAIMKVSNVLNEETYSLISPRRYQNNKKRKFWSIGELYYYTEDGYIYIPDIEIEAINVSLVTLDKKAALSLSGCGIGKDEECKSQWDHDFVCPDKLLEYIVSETLQEATIRLRIPVDENPDMDSNKKTQKEA